MGTKKLNLDLFRAMQLTSEECKNIVCGIDDKPKPTVTIRPAGGGGGGICYYDIDGELLYCTYDDDPNQSNG